GRGSRESRRCRSPRTLSRSRESGGERTRGLRSEAARRARRPRLRRGPSSGEPRHPRAELTSLRRAADLFVAEQPIAHAPHVEDAVLRAGKRELAPQSRGMRVEGARTAERDEPPDLAQKLFLREHARGVG